MAGGRAVVAGGEGDGTGGARPEPVPEGVGKGVEGGHACAKDDGVVGIPRLLVDGDGGKATAPGGPGAGRRAPRPTEIGGRRGNGGGRHAQGGGDVGAGATATGGVALGHEASIGVLDRGRYTFPASE